MRGRHAVRSGVASSEMLAGWHMRMPRTYCPVEDTRRNRVCQCVRAAKLPITRAQQPGDPEPSHHSRESHYASAGSGKLYAGAVHQYKYGNSELQQGRRFIVVRLSRRRQRQYVSLRRHTHAYILGLVFVADIYNCVQHPQVYFTTEMTDCF